MSDYGLFLVLIGAVIGIVLNLLIEWVTDNYRPRKTAKAVQPVIEVYSKNYKKISASGKAFNKTI